jgi:hypothetical protein
MNNPCGTPGQPLVNTYNNHNVGAYLASQLQCGRSVSVPRLGVFTFMSPDVRLDGCTIQSNEPLRPVFIICKSLIRSIDNTLIRRSGCPGMLLQEQVTSIFK